MPGKLNGQILIEASEYTLSGDEINLSFINDYVYCSFIFYSANLATNSKYILTSNNQAVIEWTQSSSSITI